MHAIHLKLIHGNGHFGFLCMGKNHPEPPLTEPPSAENRVVLLAKRKHK